MVVVYYIVSLSKERSMRKHKQKPARGRRTIFLWLCLLAAVGGYLWWGNNDLMVERAVFSSPRLPEGFDGFRIVQLSDLHEKEFGRGNQRLLEAVAAEDPDLIALTGDLVDRVKGADPAYVDTVCRGLAGIAPTYFVTGNHEWAVGNVPRLKKQMAALGVTVLSNQFVDLYSQGDRMVLAGIDDPNGYADQKTPEELAEELRTAFGDSFWVLLAHRNSRFADQYSLLGADLVLTGHGHGGIVRLPFTDGLISHEFALFPSYMSGFYRENGSTMFASRGLGNSTPSFRIFNRPEIAVITLSRETV